MLRLSCRSFGKAIPSLRAQNFQSSRSKTICLAPLPSRTPTFLPSYSCARHKLYTTQAQNSDASKKQKRSGKQARKHREEESSNSRSLLDQSKAEEFLQRIGSGSREVTLADIERYRPPGHAAVDSPRYEKEYTELIEALMRTFSLDQFRQFLRLYRLEPLKGRRTKWFYVAAIVEKQWGWPSVADLKEKRKEWTEIVFKSFPLDVREAFLMLGKDGSDLLALSSQYNVHVSFSPQPLALKVEGVKASVDKITERVVAIQKGIVQEAFALPNQAVVDVPTLQRISRLSGVFLEHHGGGIIKLYSRPDSSSSTHYAKRLLIEAAFFGKSSRPVHISFFGSDDVPAQIDGNDNGTIQRQSFALYPFFSPRPLPSLCVSPNMFRLRAVERQFEGIFDRPETSLNEDWLSSCTSGSRDRMGDLLDSAHRVISEHHYDHTCVSAYFGHLVIPGKDQQPSILPPVTGPQAPQHIINFLSDHSSPHLFIPSLPTKVFGSFPTRPELYHRLIYRATPEHQKSGLGDEIQFIEFCVTLNAAPYSTTKLEAAKVNDSLWSDGVVDNLPRSPSEMEDQHVILTPEYRVGALLELDLAMPSRMMDVRFAFTNASTLSQKLWPLELREYLDHLRAHLTTEGLPRPDPPLTVSNGLTTYGLYESNNVRQHIQPHKSADGKVDTIIEDILDLGNGGAHKVCRAVCHGSGSVGTWGSLLSIVDSLNNLPLSNIGLQQPPRNEGGLN